MLADIITSVGFNHSFSDSQDLMERNPLRFTNTLQSQTALYFSVENQMTVKEKENVLLLTRNDDPGMAKDCLYK